MFKRSNKYSELIAHYMHMAEHGYERRRGGRVNKVYSDQEALKFRNELQPLFRDHSISSVLDYGGGGGDWGEKQVESGQTLSDFLGVSDYRVFEPSRKIDNRQAADAVVCFDVMEHIYLADIGFVLNDIFSLATRLVVINVATYKANALLPNGENAHITVRSNDWWRGAVDLVSSAHPDIAVVLFCSDTYRSASRQGPWCFNDLNSKTGFER